MMTQTDQRMISKNQYADEKENGTRASIEKPGIKLLVIGGPAEGSMVKEFPNQIMHYPEIKSVVFTEYNANIINDIDYLEKGYTTHQYFVRKLAYKEENGRVWTKKIYVHSSLDNGDAAVVRLKEFLMMQFIRMEDPIAD